MANVTITPEAPEAQSVDAASAAEEKLTIGHCVALLVLLFAIGRMVTYLLSTFGMLP